MPPESRPTALASARPDKPTTPAHVSPRSAALGRHGHTAVVYGDAMYVYGGRSPQPVGDFWKYDFTMQAWTEQPSSEGMAARFGHTAVVSGGKMLVHGGYLRDSDELTTEIWSYEFATGEWTKIGPRVSNFDAPYNADPADAIVFPALLASPRFSAVLKRPLFTWLA